MSKNDEIVQLGGGTPLYKEAGGPSGVRFWYVWGSICTLYIVLGGGPPPLNTGGIPHDPPPRPPAKFDSSKFAKSYFSVVLGCLRI